MALVRILQTSVVTLTHVFTTDEAPTDAGGAVTATVKRLDGTVVSTATATHAGVGTYSTPVTSAALDALTVDWTGSVGGSTVTARDTVEVVGGFLFGLSEARTLLGLSTAAWPSAALAVKRTQVEQECERICRRAFVPRFAREVLSGTGTDRLGLRWSEIRAVRAVSVGGVAMSTPDLAALGFADLGAVYRPAGAIWPTGRRNVVVEYEHGWDYPPEDLRDAVLLRLRSILPRQRSGVPDRTTSYTDQSGATFRLSQPTLDTTGIPDVDGTYMKYARARRAVVA